MLQLTVSQDLDPISQLLDDPLLQKRLRRHAGSRLELCESVEIDYGVFLAEHIVEPALWQAAMQGHLSPFKTGTNRCSRSRLLSLVTPGSRLAMPAPNPATNPLVLAIGPSGRRQRVKR